MANTTVNPYVQARGSTRITYPANADMPLFGQNGGELLTAQGLAAKASATALGGTWQCSMATGSAFAPVAAWPTTLANIVFKNNYGAASGVCMVLESAWLACITSIAAASALTLLMQIVASSATALTDDTAQLITSRSGKSAYGGSVTRAVTNTAYAVASKWEVIGTSPAGAAASVGLAAYADLQGGFIVPPQALVCLGAVGGTVAGTLIAGLVWSEYVIPLG